MTEQERQQIARINELSATARTSWLALLAFLAYIGITLLAVEDADFFVPSRQTQLPLVGIAVPTAAFFLFAPVLAAALYVYLHIHLLKLWDALADAPAEIAGRPLGEAIHPWIANDYALTLKSRDGPAALRLRPLRTLGNLASLLFVWAAGPIVLGAFWWRSMPAHDPMLTLVIAGCLLLAFHAGITSLIALRTRLGLAAHGTRVWERRDPLLLGAFLVVTSLLHTTWPLQFAGYSTLAPINLSGARLVPLPPDWRSPETARAAFRETWCRREGLPMPVCDHLPHADRARPPHVEAERLAWCDRHLPEGADCIAHFAGLDRRFVSDWSEERGAAIASHGHLDLSGRDLRRAVAPGVSLVGADLTGARLEGAELGGARLEGADLRAARLDGADLSSAQLGRAELGSARLEGADVSRARLEGANLGGARLEGANLRWARLEGAFLGRARLEGANLGGARLAWADLGWARLEGADLRQARLEGADLSGAWLQDADLTGARLQGTQLIGARLEGALSGGADFRSADWSNASILGTRANSSDFRGGQGLTQAQLDQAIGNARTLLPDGPSETGEPYHVRACWDRAAPPDAFDALVARQVRSGLGPPEEIRARFLCPEGEDPAPIGTPCALELTREQCLDPARNPHHPANRAR